MPSNKNYLYSAIRNDKILPNQHGTSWDKMPTVLKNLMGTYLLKENVIDSTSTTTQINQAISNRKNMDLPFIDRKNNYKSTWKYTLLPWQILKKNIKDVDIEEVYDSDDEGADLPAYLLPCLCQTAVSVMGLPIAITATPIGLFADSGRAIKRLHDDHKDEVLHRKIIGRSPSIMK